MLKLNELGEKLRQRIQRQLDLEDAAKRGKSPYPPADSRLGPIIQNGEKVTSHTEQVRQAVQPANNKPKAPKAYGANHPRYRITVNLTLAGRSSDPDGQLSTLLDCWVRAVKRLRGLDR